LGDTGAVVPVVQTVASDEHTSLTDMTIGRISAKCDRGGGGGSGWCG